MPELSAPMAAPEDTATLMRTQQLLFRRSLIAQFGPLAAADEWVWHGYFAKRHLVLLTGQWKVGKTTLLAALLATLGAGGNLVGRAVTPSRAVVVTSETINVWSKRMVWHNIGDAVSFVFVPFEQPSLSHWLDLIDDLADEHRRQPIDLLVVDQFTAIAPPSAEKDSLAMTEVLRPLRALAQVGPCVVLVHYAPKGIARDGQYSRGTSALPALVDCQMEMHWMGRAASDNRQRMLLAWSRHDETPRRVTIELAANGTAFSVVPAEAVPQDEATKMIVELVAANPGMTAREIWDAYRPTEARPRLRLVNERLQALVAFGRMKRCGAGHRFEPYRYGMVSIDPPAPTTHRPNREAPTPLP